MSSLDLYEKTWATGDFSYLGYNRVEENSLVREMKSFVSDNPACFERVHLEGHITGSALVVTPKMDKVLLTLHRKLGKWIQLGGHADGEGEVPSVAMREAQEESGLSTLSFLPYESVLENAALEAPLPFDLDVHRIPANSQDPTHFHYDVRYVIVASEPDKVQMNAESRELKWHSLDEAYEMLSEERSMRRQLDKLKWLTSSLR